MSVIRGENPPQETPKWLEALENKRKRPHKLAHEIGAGAPCLVCREGCKGLNLHFWRKLCIECKCRKEDHEVEEEDDYAQFEILFGTKKVKRTTLKFDAITKSFDWIPPNVPPDLVVDYLKSIPSCKVPISNSEGARYRKQQLKKQVPLHDVDPTACHNLSLQETEQFNKYLDNLRNNVIGQGKVIKYQSPHQQKVNELFIHDLTPSMMANSEHYAPATKLQGSQLIPHFAHDKNHYLKPQTDFPPGISHLPVPSSFSSDPQKENQFRKPASGAPRWLVGSTDSPLFNHSNGSHDKKLLPQGSSIFHKENTNETGHQEDCGGSRTDSNSKDFIGAHSKPENQSHPLAQTTNFANSKGLDAVICKHPLDKFKELQVSSKSVPFTPVQEVESLGPRRNKGDDKPRSHVRDNEEEKTSGQADFPSPPATCQQCFSIINPEEVVVQTDRGGTTALWHAQCFVCDTCKELLVDLMYFFNKGKVFCGRHYAEMMNIPRCYACDELIFMKEYTCAEGCSYHVKHFCCFHCDEPLAGKQYIPKDSNPICLECYQSKYGKKCHTCCCPILAGEQRVSWQHLDFHVSGDCFRCTNCRHSLLGGKFLVKNEQVFCSKECVMEVVK